MPFEDAKEVRGKIANNESQDDGCDFQATTASAKPAR